MGEQIRYQSFTDNISWETLNIVAHILKFKKMRLHNKLDSIYISNIRPHC